MVLCAIRHHLTNILDLVRAFERIGIAACGFTNAAQISSGRVTQTLASGRADRTRSITGFSKHCSGIAQVMLSPALCYITQSLKLALFLESTEVA